MFGWISKLFGKKEPPRRPGAVRGRLYEEDQKGSPMKSTANFSGSVTKAVIIRADGTEEEIDMKRKN